MPIKVNNKINKQMISLRPAAGDSDIRFAGLLSGRVFDVYGPYQESIPRWLESGIGQMIVAQTGGRPIGFAIIGNRFEMFDMQPSSELLAIAVYPENQDMGVGKLLLEGVDNMAFETGINRIFLHTAVQNFSAQSLFSWAGYRIRGVKKCFYPEGQDALLMFKVLFESV